MRINTLRIDGQAFILAPSQDIDELKAQIVRVAAGPPAFVEFETIGRGTIAVLITALQPVRFEVIERSDEQVSEWEQNPPPIDTHDHMSDLELYPE